MNKINRIICRLSDDELKKLKQKSVIEDEGNLSFTIRKALRFYLFKE